MMRRQTVKKSLIVFGVLFSSLSMASTGLNLPLKKELRCKGNAVMMNASIDLELNQKDVSLQVHFEEKTHTEKNVPTRVVLNDLKHAEDFYQCEPYSQDCKDKFYKFDIDNPEEHYGVMNYAILRSIEDNPREPVSILENLKAARYSRTYLWGRFTKFGAPSMTEFFDGNKELIGRVAHMMPIFSKLDCR